jgi:hypothetical protein
MASRTLAEVRAELREWLYDMKCLHEAPGLGFDQAYMAARRRADVLAREYTRLVEAEEKK